MDFERLVEVTVGPPGDAREIVGLRAAFDVSMTGSSAPQTATVRLWNPAPSTVARSRASGALLRVRAGYRGRATLGTVFLGQVIPGGIQLDREGPDTILTIEAGDGWVTLADTYVSESFATDIAAREIVQVVADAMGIETAVVDVPGSVRFPRGIAVQGSARAILDDLAESTGAQWRIVDGRLVFAPATSPYEGGSGPLLSSTAGTLIGAPTLMDGDQVSVRALLQPALRPGLGFRVQASDVSGDYLATEVQHVGDTWGSDYYTVATGRPL